MERRRKRSDGKEEEEKWRKGEGKVLVERRRKRSGGKE